MLRVVLTPKGRLTTRGVRDKVLHVLPTIPGYTLLQRLGEGTFGEVYKAKTAAGAFVAIKCLKEAGAQEYRRFRRECNVLFHERENAFVVDIFEASLDRPPFYLVMELCEFGSLRPWVTERQPWTTVTLALSHALQGLEGIHRSGGFHRDIKPDNLLRTRNKENSSQWIVKVGDFGLAGGDIPAASTATFSPAGSPAYMAPEVRFGNVSSASDIFSLGITGIELLTGTRDVVALRDAKCPGPLKWMLSQMVGSEPEKRPDTSTIAAMLIPFVTQPPPTPPAVPAARPSPTVARPAQAPAAVAPRPVPNPDPQRAAQPQRLAQPAVQQKQAAAVAPPGTPGTGIGLVGAAVFGLLAYLAFGQNKDWDDNVGRYRGPDGKFRR